MVFLNGPSKMEDRSPFLSEGDKLLITSFQRQTLMSHNNLLREQKKGRCLDCLETQFLWIFYVL
ncbi:MAG: hypothetical protein DMG05_12020 [Acidobacteria bacterium]|nr:MAG: hypothetical protein DMG05_12020 [Acidobacteriota bacterium]